MSQNSAAYLQATESTNAVDSPAVGFAQVKDYHNTQKLVEAILRKNNTLIELVIKLDQRLTEVQQSVLTLQRNKQTAQPDVTKAINELSAKLAGVTITGNKGKEPVKATSAPYYVFKNPKAIFNEEKAKK